MSELKIPDDLNTRYKLAKAQLALLPSIDDDINELFLGTRYQCEEVIQLIERIAALEAERTDWKNGAAMEEEEFQDICASENIRPSTCCQPKYCRLAPFHEIKLLRRVIDALKAPVSDEAFDLLKRIVDKLHIALPIVDNYIVLQSLRMGAKYDGPSLEQELKEADALIAARAKETL